MNETFIKETGITDPVCKKIPFKYGDLENPTIIGVVKDYHFLSPKSELAPLVIYTSPQYQLQNLLVKLKPGFTNSTVEQVEDTWRTVYPTMPFNYGWLNEINQNQMAQESQIRRLASLGSIMSIVLASLGLFGMVATHVKQRMKEVSIRKISGAGPWDIYLLFGQKFGKWLLLGFFIGTLAAIYVLSHWLNNYPERISLTWVIPMIAVLICGTIFLVVISSLLVKVVRVNPVVYLRDE